MAMKPLARVLVPVAIAVLLASCEPLGGYFDDYYDAAGDPINLIENRGFGITDWVPDQSAPFMAFAVVGTAEGIDTTGLPAGFSGDICRLEILNLLPNGDFEATPLGTAPAGWVSSGTATTVEVQDASTALNGRYLYYVLGACRTESGIGGSAYA